MKIVIYAGNGGSGGLKGWIKGVLSACCIEPETEIVVICTADFGDYIRGSISNNVRLIETPDAATRLIDYLKGCRLPKSILAIIDKEKPDIVYFTNSVVFRGVENYKTAVSMHNQLYIDTKQLRRQKDVKGRISLEIQRIYALKSLKKVDLVVFDSKQSMQQTTEKKIRFRKGIVAYFGVEAAERCGKCKEIVPSETTDLLYISTIFPYKNQEKLVCGIAELKRRGFSIRLHLVGSGPERYVSSLKKKISELGVDEEVIFYSWIEHSKVKDMIDACDIFVYASSIETSAFGVMEGMVRGAVIACNNESCMPEILGDGGVLFEIDSPENTADVLQQLIENAELRQKLSQRAIEKSTAYTWEHHARTVLESFKMLMAD